MNTNFPRVSKTIRSEALLTGTLSMEALVGWGWGLMDTDVPIIRIIFCIWGRDGSSQRVKADGAEGGYGLHSAQCTGAVARQSSRPNKHQRPDTAPS